MIVLVTNYLSATLNSTTVTQIRHFRTPRDFPPLTPEQREVIIGWVRTPRLFRPFCIVFFYNFFYNLVFFLFFLSINRFFSFCLFFFILFFFLCIIYVYRSL